MGVARRARIVALVLLCGCSSPTGHAEDELREHLERWTDLGLDSYSFEYRRMCYCGGPVQPLRVVVRQDAVVSVTDPATGRTPPFLTPEWTGTIDEIFQRLIDDAATVASMELAFDPTHHFPTRAKVDRIENAIDDEYELSLADLRIGP
jgi:hypothetical protein